jgi:hypothetical protein
MIPVKDMLPDLDIRCACAVFISGVQLKEKKADEAFVLL